MLKIKKEPKNEIYSNLIMYACQKCDTVLFVIRYDSLMNNIARFDKVCELTGLSKLELLNEYQKNGTNNIYKTIKHSKYKTQLSKDIIEVIIDGYEQSYQEYLRKRKKMELIKQSLKDDLILERHNPEWCGTTSWFEPFFSQKNFEERMKTEYCYKGDYIYDICFYRMSRKIRDFLLKQNKLYAFLSPKLPEDISFFKDGYCWLNTVSHEYEAYIYTQDKKEIEHLSNNIGLEFEKYETSEKEIPYEKYH